MGAKREDGHLPFPMPNRPYAVSQEWRDLTFMHWKDDSDRLQPHLPDGLEIDKLKIRYTDADGFKVFNEIEYDGEVYYLEEDSTGKSSSFYVSKGDNLK